MESTIFKKPIFQFTGKIKEWLIFGICLICNILFLYTAYLKIAEYEIFEKGLSKVAIIGSYAETIAWFVPVAEILIAILLIIPPIRKWGLYGFTSLMILFTVYILSMLLWAEKLPCLCGGAIEKLSWQQHIWFNLGFIALSIIAIMLSKSFILKK